MPPNHGSCPTGTGEKLALGPEISRNRLNQWAPPKNSRNRICPPKSNLPSQFLAYELQVLRFGRWDFACFFGGISTGTLGVGSGNLWNWERDTGGDGPRFWFIGFQAYFNGTLGIKQPIGTRVPTVVLVVVKSLQGIGVPCHE